MSIGEQIETYLSEHPDERGQHMSPTEFARLVEAASGTKTSRQVIDGILRNPARVPRRDTLRGISIVLGKTVDALLGQSSGAPSPLPAPATVHAFPSIESALTYLGRVIAQQNPSRRKAIGALLATYAENPKANADSARAIALMIDTSHADKRPSTDPTPATSVR